MSNVFWSNNITELFNKNAITQIWPNPCMTFESKLNAITRLVILLTTLGFIFTLSLKYLIMGILTLIFIYALYKYRKQKLIKSILNKEGFTSDAIHAPTDNKNKDSTDSTNINTVLNNYYKINKKNPLGNVLLPEITSDPNRPPAPPAFNSIVKNRIDNETKKMIQTQNSTVKNTNSQLFGNLYEENDFDNSMWNYYANPITTVPNDQCSFAQFLYGDMTSCKSGDAIQCAKNVERYIV